MSNCVVSSMLFSRHTRRRDFIAGLAGAAAWPLGVRAQQGERVRRIGIFMNLASDDAEGQSRNAAFLQGLQELGWSVGRNVRIDYRWGANNLDPDRMRKDAADLLALSPDVVVADLRSAKALGLSLPLSLLGRANEVIE